MDIPDEFVADGRAICFYIWKNNDEDGGGETIGEGTITTIPKPIDGDVPPTPEQESIIDQAIDALNEGVERAENAAEDAEGYARDAETAKNAAEAARDAVEDLGVTAHETAAGSGPSVDKTVDPETGAVTLDFGLPAAPVTAVNGQTGEVNLDAEDVGALPGSSTLDDIPDGATYKRATAAQIEQIAENAGDIEALQGDVGSIEGKIPNAASAQNQLADKQFVTESITQGTAIYRGSYASRAALLAVAWQTTDPDAANYVSNNDYAYVLDDETHDDECWRYLYVTGTGWTAQVRINESPLTQAQLDALNSGATAALIAQITVNETAIQGKQNKITASGILKGDGSTVSAAMPGTDYATPAQVDAKYTKPPSGIPKTDLASGVQTSLGLADTAYQKPSGGIPANDLAAGVIPTVPSAYTSNQAALGTASPGSSTNWARGDHVHPKPSAADIGAHVPVASTSVSAAGVISYKDANNNVLFTVQLPLYTGGVT